MVDGPGPLTGRSLGGYRLGPRLAHSPHADVYRATDDELGRDVAVKLVPGGAASPEAQRRCLAEARLATRIDHPYATHVYGFGIEDDGTCWMAMEWVQGATLEERVARHGALRVDEAVELAGRLAEVVSALHDQGLCHLDLKPDNVMVVGRGGRLLPRLCDFGLAAVAFDRPAGTPAYMAPEQWLVGEPGAAAVDARADVYALALCLHFALTGRPGFSGEPAALAAAHRHGPRPRLPSSFPPALADVLVGALAIEPAARPASVLELAAALRAAIDARARPRFDDAVLEAVLGGAPEPIAEAMAAWEAAPAPRAELLALDELGAIAARWLGLCAIAVRRAHGAPAAGNAPAAVTEEALAALTRGMLPASAWIALARDEAPVSELAVELDRIARVAVADPATGQDVTARLVAVQRLLRAASAVITMRLVVRRGARVERWTGVRRRRRPVIWVPDVDAFVDGVPTLADDDGRPVVPLDGLAMIDAPAAGEPEELFVLTGGDGEDTIFAAAAGYQRRVLGSPLGLATAAGGRDEIDERGPYPGLAPFATADAAWFVGREREVEACANRLRDRPLVVVVGPSGVGKSSFVLAGVVPASGATAVVVCRPGEAPAASLAAALDVAETSAIAGAAAARAAGGRLLIVIDQLEEVVTRATASEARGLGAVLVALVELDADVHVLATVRDDFLIRVASATGLGPRLAGGVVLLGPPVEDELVRIVTEPAARVGYVFDDPALPHAMVAAVAGAASPLPLLSFTAAMLWNRRDRRLRQLRRRDHDAIGGVVGALAGHADATVAALPDEARALVRPLLANLATAEGTRLALPRPELEELLGGGTAAALVIDRLVDARLLASRDDDDGAAPVIELVHEALLDAWPRLAGWRRDDAMAAQLRDAVRTAAQQWETRGRGRDLLWRGDALDELRVWRRRHPVRLTAREEAFCGASLHQGQRRRRQVRTLLVAGALAAAAVIAVLVGANREARAQRGAAATARARAVASAEQSQARLIDALFEQGRTAALDHRPREALAWFDAALGAGAAGPALSRAIAIAAAALGDDRPQPTFAAPVHVVSWSPSGKLVAAGGGSRDGRVVILEGDGTARHQLDGGGGTVTGVAIAPDDRRVAIASAAGARVWDLALGSFRQVGGDTVRVRWSPDGRHLATAGRDGVVRLFSGPELATEVRIGPHPHDQDAVTVVWLDDTRVVIGDRSGWLRLHTVDGTQLAVRRVDQPVLDLVVAGGAALTLPFDRAVATLWSPTVDRTVVLGGHTLALDAVAASRHGLVATAGGDGTVMVWRARDGQLDRALLGHRGGVTALAFAGARVISGGADGTLRSWTDGSPSVRAAHGVAITALAVSPDGARVISGDADGAVALWTVDELDGPPTLPLHRATTLLVDGERWIAVGHHGVAEVAPVPRPLAADPAPTGAEGPLLVSYRRGAAVALDGTIAAPDGEAAVALDRRGTVAARCELGAAVSVAAISARHGWLAAAGPGGRLTACAPGAPPRVLPPHRGAVWALSYAPDGRHLASGGADGVVHLDELAGGRRITAALEAGVTALGWSSDGRELVATTLDGELVRVGLDGSVATLWPGDGVPANALAIVDEDHVAAGFEDGGVVLLSRPLGRPVARWRLGSSISWLTVAAGARLVAVHGDGAVALPLGAALTPAQLHALVECRSGLQVVGGRLTRAPRRCP